MKNLKNIFKCLSVAAIAGMVSMGTVNAADGALACGEGKTVHTNYYLFLAANGAAGLNEAIDNAATESTDEKTVYANIFSGANKWNNIPLGTGTRQGDIPITIGADDNTEKGLTDDAINKLDKLSLAPWTASDFWKNFYAAHMNKDSKTNIYTTGDVSYILHDGYWTYTDANGNGQSATQTSPYKDLLNYLSTRVNNLTNTSPIVRTGTNLPFTTVVAPTSDFGNATSDTLLFRVNRQFSTSDKKSGIDLQNGQKAVIYSPAVYYVQFCKEKTSTTPDTPTTGNYTVKYDANGGKDAPAAQTSKVGACVEISKTAPKYTGQNFLGWSTDPKAVEPDKKYAAGEKYCEDKDITLYAVWNTKTGISAHVVAFGLMAVVAAGALVVAKKKNLFKQI